MLTSELWGGDDMAAPANVVNLDALIKRADLAEAGEIGDDIEVLSITGLEKGGLLYPALRKPDFQRETANWSPELVADLIATFVRRELIPAVILWRSGYDVFVIDGAHRLSALIAWVHDDYGDRDISRKFFQNVIPEEQERNAKRTRDLVKARVGTYEEHKQAIENPEGARPDVRARAARLGWEKIHVQWVRNSDHTKAEKAFFRINKGGTKIEKIEERILMARRSASALAARAILRGGTGNAYWKSFLPETRAKIEELGREIHKLLYEPALTLPVRTLDVPLGGQGYGPRALPFVVELVNLINRVPPSGGKKDKEGFWLPDETGEETLDFLVNVRRVVWRLCSNHPSSLGLHPALYFYSKTSTFQPASFHAYAALFNEWETPDFERFTRVRSEFEEFTLINRGITEAVRHLGGGSKSRPRLLALYRTLIERLEKGETARDLTVSLSSDHLFKFLVSADSLSELWDEGGAFSRDIKGGAYLQSALPSAPKCPTCRGLMHINGMQVGHKKARRDGGPGSLENAAMQHPLCNSTIAN
jgi:hypothetical protein